MVTQSTDYTLSNLCIIFAFCDIFFCAIAFSSNSFIIFSLPKFYRELCVIVLEDCTLGEYDICNISAGLFISHNEHNFRNVNVNESAIMFINW